MIQIGCNNIQGNTATLQYLLLGSIYKCEKNRKKYQISEVHSRYSVTLPPKPTTKDSQWEVYWICNLSNNITCSYRDICVEIFVFAATQNQEITSNHFQNEGPRQYALNKHSVDRGIGSYLKPKPRFKPHVESPSTHQPASQARAQASPLGDYYNALCL